MVKRMVISSSRFKRKKAGTYTEMVIYKNEKNGTSKTRHEPIIDNEKIRLKDFEKHSSIKR